MTVIRPNSISGITSITAQANEIKIFRSNGTIAGLNLNGVNFNTTAGISTLAALKVTGNLDVEGVLTYQDVTNVDSLGIGTFRTGINVSGGQLDVGSNIKLGNAGVITATSFSGSGANLTGVLSDIVEDTSPQLGGNLDCNNKNISLNDSTGVTNNRIKIGTNDDLQLWHNASTGNSNVSNYNGDLYIQGNNGSGTGVNQIAIKSNAAVELNYQGTKKFETSSSGVDITGNLHVDDLPNTTTNSYLKIAIQDTDGVFKSDDTIKINPAQDALSVNGLFINSNTVRASGNGPLNLTTANASGTVDLLVKTTHVECNGNFLPQTDNTDDLGSLSTRWANIYTADLNLSNEGSKNDVDGTWGQYTIQEGEDNLYLINKRSGKKYKFLLQEVS